MSDALVSTSYLALFYDVDLSPLGLLRGHDPVVDTVCPVGGRVSGSTTPFAFDVVLDRCGLNGVTLSGGLARDSDFSVFGLGHFATMTFTFDALRIETTEAVTLELTGFSRRYSQSFANIECGGAPRLTDTIDNRIDAARLENPGGTTAIGAASWSQARVTGVQRSGAPAGSDSASSEPCTALDTLTFDGAAAVASTRFGTRDTTIAKRGDIVRDARGETDSSASARLAADFGDGSTLAVTLTSDADDAVRVDIAADGVAVSFEDTHAFEAREEIPPIFGD